ILRHSRFSAAFQAPTSRRSRPRQEAEGNNFVIMWTAKMPVLLKNNPDPGSEPGFIDKPARSRYKSTIPNPPCNPPPTSPHPEHGWAFLRMKNAR
ncbi:MAG: hypothetical protein ACLT8C_11565, partial [Akkermansia muciniphila]